MKKEWPDRSEYPFAPHYCNIGGHRMHYIDEGKGPVLLFVHGTPSWSFDFRHLVMALRSHYRCIAPDLVGFGLSDKPADYDYSPQQHSRNLDLLIDQLKLEHITLIVHDFGGPIGLQATIRRPVLFDRLVILNSWLWDNSDDPAFIRLRRILNSPLTPLLYRYLNFSPRFLLPASFGDRKLPRRLLSQYTGAFPSPGQRYGPLAFARSLVRDQPWFGSLWDARAVLLDKPTLIIWGMKDPILPGHHLDRFKAGFPDASVVRLDTCGHFPQEEGPEAVLEALTNWLADTRQH